MKKNFICALIFVSSLATSASLRADASRPHRLAWKKSLPLETFEEQEQRWFAAEVGVAREPSPAEVLRTLDRPAMNLKEAHYSTLLSTEGQQLLGTFQDMQILSMKVQPQKTHFPVEITVSWQKEASVSVKVECEFVENHQTLKGIFVVHGDIQVGPGSVDITFQHPTPSRSSTLDTQGITQHILEPIILKQLKRAFLE